MQYEPRPQRILLPVSPLFMGFTLACALTFNLLPWRNVSGMPDLVALVLAFWGVHQPRRISVGIAFAFGIVMDVANGALLGQHAFAYAALAFTAATGQAQVPQRGEVWSLKLGATIGEQPGDFVDYACGSAGGAPSIPLTSMADFKRCRAEESGLR